MNEILALAKDYEVKDKLKGDNYMMLHDLIAYQKIDKYMLSSFTVLVIINGNCSYRHNLIRHRNKPRMHIYQRISNWVLRRAWVISPFISVSPASSSSGSIVPVIQVGNTIPVSKIPQDDQA
jgi:hypothetical protein